MGIGVTKTRKKYCMTCVEIRIMSIIKLKMKWSEKDDCRKFY